MDCDVLIVGAGVVGLAVAMKLSEKYSCVLIERNNSFGTETSSRNSEVLHSGIYYPANSLKTQLCVAGNPLIYEHCNKFSVPYSRCGKYIVAINSEDSENLDNIYQNAIENEVAGIRYARAEELAENEPFVSASNALFAPNTGIIDTHSLMKSFETIACENGCNFAYNHKLIAIEKLGSGYISHIQTSDGDTFELWSNLIVNCAGLESDKIAEMLGIDTVAEGLALNYCKGHYFKIQNPKFRFKHLIYPAPEKIKTGLGIHVTIDLQGLPRLGPDTLYMDSREFDFSVPDTLKEKFLSAVQRYIKGINIEDLVPDYSGLRPKIQKPSEAFADFYIKEESERGLPGFINLIGIESPGLTSSLAIANYVGKLV